MMKKENMLTYMGIIIFVLSVGSLILYKIYESRLQEFFYAAIGLLTFTSLFYSFTISKGAEVLEEATKYLESKENFYIRNLSPKKLKKQENLPQYLTDASKKIEDIQNAKGYLNLNLWLFISTLGYFFSILVYLMRGTSGSWTTFAQIFSFWTGFYSSLLIVCVWFVVNKIFIKKHSISKKSIEKNK